MVTGGLPEQIPEQNQSSGASGVNLKPRPAAGSGFSLGSAHRAIVVQDNQLSLLGVYRTVIPRVYTAQQEGTYGYRKLTKGNSAACRGQRGGPA